MSHCVILFTQFQLISTCNKEGQGGGVSPWAIYGKPCSLKSHRFQLAIRKKAVRWHEPLVNPVQFRAVEI